MFVSHVRVRATVSHVHCELREARPDDLSAMVAMLVDDEIGRRYESDADEARPDYLAAFYAILASPDNQLVVAVCDGVVVGMLQITFSPGLNRRGGWRATIETVRVRRDKRRMGIGAALMRDAIGRAQRRACAIVQLTAHRSRQDAHCFYEGLGFSPSHFGMKMTLPPPDGAGEL
jgi:ribosomal protein S18 acetylase RimI-like enzyme